VPYFGKYWKSLEAHLKYESQFPSRLHQSLFEDGVSAGNFKTREEIKVGSIKIDSFIERGNKELFRAIHESIHTDRLQKDPYYKAAWEELNEIVPDHAPKITTAQEAIEIMTGRKVNSQLALPAPKNQSEEHWRPVNIVGIIN